MSPATPWVRETAHCSKKNHNLQGEGHPATLVHFRGSCPQSRGTSGTAGAPV